MRFAPVAQKRQNGTQKTVRTQKYQPMTRGFKILVVVWTAVLLASACEREPGAPSQAVQALEKVKRLYKEARDKVPEDPVEWAKEDIQRYGDWEYRIIVLADGEPSTLEERLNKLGEERWEVFWVERSDTDLRLFLKRPVKSYLRAVPLSELGKAISGGE